MQRRIIKVDSNIILFMMIIFKERRGPKSYRTVGTAKHPNHNKQSPRLTVSVLLVIPVIVII